jgi:hypothetical protein
MENPYNAVKCSLSINDKVYYYFNLRSVDPEKYGKLILIICLFHVLDKYVSNVTYFFVFVLNISF